MTMRRTTPALAVVIFWWSSVVCPAQALAPAVAAPPDLDATVARVMQTFEVPGVSLAVVKDGRVVLARGYGVRKMGESARVDARTLFGIASNTKAFTAVALGLLVEEGKLEWDGPVIDHLPQFQLWDAWVTREITVRDLLVHRSGLGLGAGDLLWWPPTTYDRPEIMRRLRFIKPATSFRSAYAYDNVLYLVAGQLIEAVSGQSWEEFVTQRILRKVGMDSSNVRHSMAAEGANSAWPHAAIDGKVRPIAPFASDNTNPAGGINSGAEDMAKWMLVLLGGGTLADGSRLYSEATAKELWTLVTPIPIGNSPPELSAMQSQFRGYALGFGVQDYRGRKLVSHTGGLPGFLSRVALVPEAGVGVAVLLNQESGEAFNSLVFEVLDHYLGAPPTDWIDAFEKTRKRREAAMAVAEERIAGGRDAASKPSLPLEKYAGTYRDAWYGDIDIVKEGRGLTIRFSRTPALVGDLEHWQHDTFVARWRDRELRADAFVTFALTPGGAIDQAKMKAVSPATDFSFDFHDLLLKPVAPVEGKK